MNNIHNIKALRLATTLAFFLIGLLSLSAEKPNILLVCVDDLRPELNCFGVDYIHSPNIDRLAASGRAFHNHYANAPTCGASRYSLLTGDYYQGAKNHALFDRAKQLNQGCLLYTSPSPRDA